MDLDRFEEQAAILEFDEGMTRYQAECLAAAWQGKARWEAMDAIRQRDTGRGGNNRSAHRRDAANNVPGVQPAPEEENGPVLVGDVEAGRDRLELLALRAQRGGVV